MKKLYLLFLFPLLALPFFGFVDPDSYPVYSGSLSLVDSNYTPSVSLDGETVDYWLIDYDVSLSDSGYLVNVSGSTLTGSISVDGTEYSCRISSGSDVFEVYQKYSSSYSSSSAWIDYNLTPSVLPSDGGSSFDSWILFAVLIPVLILAFFGVVKFILG